MRLHLYAYRLFCEWCLIILYTRVFLIIQYITLRNSIGDKIHSFLTPLSIFIAWDNLPSCNNFAVYLHDRNSLHSPACTQSSCVAYTALFFPSTRTTPISFFAAIYANPLDFDNWLLPEQSLPVAHVSSCFWYSTSRCIFCSRLCSVNILCLMLLLTFISSNVSCDIHGLLSLSLLPITCVARFSLYCEK